VAKGQIEFEFSHLLKKLEKRDRERFDEIKKKARFLPETNPIFYIIEGEVENWEII